MINGKRIAVVMPAYNAAKTLEKTVLELPETVDLKILVDDNGVDDTVRIAEERAYRSTFMRKTMDTGGISRHATRRRLPLGRTLS